MSDPLVDGIQRLLPPQNQTGASLAAKAPDLNVGFHPIAKLPDILERFNRKERNLLVRDILGHREANLRLSDDFLGRVNQAAHVKLASNTWWATDFHIDWLFAAVMMAGSVTHAGKVQQDKKSKLVTGTQEDFDLVLADDQHLILIEAKAHGAWNQKQFDGKLKRFEELRSLAGEWVKVRLILMSPKKSKKLVIPDQSDVRWLTFAFDSNLTSYRVTRCDVHGNIGRDGGHWKVLERPAAEPAAPDDV